MSDPVAEAAAQLAAQSAEPSLLEKAMGTIHDLEAKVEHLIHPDTPGNEPAVAAESATAPAIAEIPNDATTPPAGDATGAAGDLPNVASDAVVHTTAPDSASNAAGADTTKSTAASSGEPPLHIRIAEHLEAIYTLARDSSVSTETAAMRAAAATKTHIGDVLHRISNGMQVTEGELVQKLEALYRML